MIREAMDKVLELAKPHVVDIDPERVDSQLVYLQAGYNLVEPAEVNVLALASLDAMVRFCNLEREGCEDMFLHVLTDATVRLYGPPHQLYKNRELFAKCTVPAAADITGLGERQNPAWMTADKMIPRILTGFEDEEHRAALLKVLGNVRDGAAATYQDDGVTQTVSTRRGVSMAELTELPSPITLVPRANYPEVVNVPQPYVLRAEGGDDEEPPVFVLLRINDPAFSLLRRNTIVEYFADHLPNLPVV